jgi:hypothetical protein
MKIWVGTPQRSPIGAAPRQQVLTQDVDTGSPFGLADIEPQQNPAVSGCVGFSRELIPTPSLLRSPPKWRVGLGAASPWRDLR